MALGACLLVDLLLRFPQIDDFYTDNGVLPREALLLYRAPVLSLHMASGAWPFQAGLLLLSIVAAVGLIAGYRTRLVTVVSWVALVFLQARNPLAAHAGDRLLKALLFWGMFLPLNGRWSVDDKRQELPSATFRPPASRWYCRSVRFTGSPRRRR